jgi:hypothetical protein
MNWQEIFSLQNLQNIATICGTIIFTVYMSFRTFKTKLDKAMSENKTDVPKEIEKQSELDCAIMAEAEKLKEILNADRVQVYEFHNGVHYANGRSALKTTCTYETCRYGISGCLNTLSGIPLSVIPVFIRVLLDKGMLLVKDLEDIKATMPSTYELKKAMGVKSFYDYVIRNSVGEPVGFVAVQFCDGDSHFINEDAVKKFAWFVENKLLEI